MRLSVGWSGGMFTRGVHYDIEVEAGGRRPSASQLRRLRSLRPRIEKVSKRELGRHFIDLVDHTRHGGALRLRVKTGTSSAPGVKFKLRSLLGWIELLDSEKD